MRCVGAIHIAFSEQAPPLCLFLKIYGKQAFFGLLPILLLLLLQMFNLRKRLDFHGDSSIL
jgi:hypothetical protein